MRRPVLATLGLIVLRRASAATQIDDHLIEADPVTSNLFAPDYAIAGVQRFDRN